MSGGRGEHPAVAGGEHVVQQQGAADQAEVAVRLRVVAQARARRAGRTARAAARSGRPCRASARTAPRRRCAGRCAGTPRSATPCRCGSRPPGRAGRRPSGSGRRPGRCAGPPRSCSTVDEEARVVVGQQPGQADPERRGVHVLVAVRDACTPGLVVPAVLQHVRADPVAQLHPLRAGPRRRAAAPRAAPGRRSSSTSPWSRRGAGAAGGPPRCRGRARASGGGPPRPCPPAPATRRRAPSRAASATAASRSAIGPKTSSWSWWLAALPTRTGREPA